jgi:hypothetical protein
MLMARRVLVVDDETWLRHTNGALGSLRRSMALMVRQAGQRTHRNQYPAVTAAPIVGEKIIGMRLAWRSFQAPNSLSIGGALVLHFAAVEAHGVMLTAARAAGIRTSVLGAHAKSQSRAWTV